MVASPYTIAMLVMQEMVVGIWSAFEQRNWGPQGQAGHHVDHWVSADPTGAPAILQVDSHPEATLKLQPPNSLDYSTRYGCQAHFNCYKNTKWHL